MSNEYHYQTKELKITQSVHQDKLYIQLGEGLSQKSSSLHTLCKALTDNAKKEIRIYIQHQDRQTDGVLDHIKSVCIQNFSNLVYLRSHSSLLFSHKTDAQKNRSIHTPTYYAHFSAQDGCFFFIGKKQQIQPFDHSFKEIRSTIAQDRPNKLSFSFMPYRKEKQFCFERRLSTWMSLLKNMSKDFPSIQKIEVFAQVNNKHILFAQAQKIAGRMEMYNPPINKLVYAPCIPSKSARYKTSKRTNDAIGSTKFFDQINVLYR